jgi:hypothetical protein
MAKRFTACFLTALAGLLLTAAPVLADPPDRFEPPVVTATLGAGESMRVAKTLHLTGLPAKADIIVAIDTTGSMSAALAAAKADAMDICNDVQAAIPGARFAAVEFQDYPFSPYGGAGDSPYELHTPGYTASCAVFSAGVTAMTLGFGGDGPESNNRVHFEAYSDPLLLSTRDPEATRFLVMLADNVPHSRAAFGACPSTAPLSDPGRDNLNGTADDIETPAAIAGLNADDHILLYISYIFGSGTLACHEDLAHATGGEAVADEDADDIAVFIIDQAQEVEYEVDLVVSGPLCQTPAGLNISFSPAPPYGPFTGPQHVDFVETITAPTTPGNYTCTVTAVMDPGGPVAEETINVTVVAGAPATLTLDPPAAENPVDSEHCVTATVRDAFLNPVPNVDVVFTVTGSVMTGGTVTTDGNGEAEFCYTGPPLPGADVIHAFADSNGSGTQDPGEPEGVAEKTWVLPVSTPLCEVKITNGGWIIADNLDKATFGGNARTDGEGNASGNEEYQDHGPADPLNLHGNVLVVVCEPPTSPTAATIYGKATVDGEGDYFYRIKVQDNGEGGKGVDRYGILIGTAPMYSSGDQLLKGGNVQVHKTD